ncbi:hypothetical protein L227DRAFT_617805 [Lentinus tigrinus ALCF2SS1-6]|uniref:Uncharacterized protein n=1 Tax=Lentinus tigrinus ALCF2SS1-6 TaxID=1328759 RepID=A0A5C2RML9_9APHY|nr:hypothetical protein L227DRAFT_617805 [Lentinus tigrinus ALCF2SS1-6]
MPSRHFTIRVEKSKKVVVGEEDAVPEAAPSSRVPQSPSPVPACSETYADIVNRYAPEELGKDPELRTLLQGAAAPSTSALHWSCRRIEDMLTRDRTSMAETLEKQEQAHREDRALHQQEKHSLTMELADANRKILALQDAASKRETEDAQARRRLEDSLKAHAETQAQLEESRKAHSDTSVLLDDMFHRVERMGRMIDESHATALRTQADYSVLQARMFEREAEYEKRQDELRTAQRQLDQKTRETTAEVNRLRQQRDGVRRTLQGVRREMECPICLGERMIARV